MIEFIKIENADFDFIVIGEVIYINEKYRNENVDFLVQLITS